MTEAQIALARRAVVAPGWRWLPGMQVRTTHAGGYPKAPAGTPVRIESDSTLSDCVTEGQFGPITREPAHTHPDFDALCDLHDKSVAEAEARILPDLSDPLTALGLLALVRERWGTTAHCMQGWRCRSQADLRTPRGPKRSGGPLRAGNG